MDYEKQTIHQVKVLAIDRAKEGNSNTGSALVLIKVEDIEDQPPEFISVTSVVRIEENCPIGTSVVQGKLVYFVIFSRYYVVYKTLKYLFWLQLLQLMATEASTTQ